MTPVTAPIKTDNKEAVNNLQAALVFLLSKQSLALTGDELSALQKQWQQEQEEANYGEATKKLVAIFQQQYKVDGPLGAVDEQTATKLNEVLTGLGAFDEEVTSFFVKGTICYSDGKPYNRATIKAFDKDLRTEELLGEAVTNANGYYEISYTQNQFAKAEKSSANIFIVVFSKAHWEKTQLSDVFFNAPAVQEINLSIPAQPEVTLSESGMMDAQLKPLLKSQYQLTNAVNVYRDLLPEELQESDFEFLSKDTGIDKRNIELWSLAYKSSAATVGVAGEVFYGWFRMDMPIVLQQLWSQPLNSLREALKNAATKNIILGLNSDALDSIQKSIIEAILSPSPEGQPASFGDIISSASTDGKDWISKEKQQQLAAIFTELDPDAEDFATKIATINFTAEELIKLQQTLRLAKVTQNNPALISGLQSIVEGKDASLKCLASLQPDKWMELAYQYGAPPGISVEPDVYAKQLEKAVEERIPTETLVNKINNGLIFRDRPGIEKFVKQLESDDDFNIAQDDVKYFSGRNGLSKTDENFLQNLQNFKNIGAPWDEIAGLFSLGITEVNDMAKYDDQQLKNVFVNNMPDTINEILRRAELAALIGKEFGGGIIAYILQPGDNGYFENETHGLIVAPMDKHIQLQWNNALNIKTGAIGTILGSGKSNTKLIVERLGTGNYAADYCNKLEIDGTTDWYLPSKDELQKIILSQVNSFRNIFFVHDNLYYWSSSEINNKQAFTSNQLPDNKYKMYQVIPVRSF